MPIKRDEALEFDRVWSAAGAWVTAAVFKHQGPILDKTRSDIAVLQEYLGDANQLTYVDFQESEAVRAALGRWPLLRRLLQPQIQTPPPSPNEPAR